MSRDDPIDLTGLPPAVLVGRIVRYERDQEGTVCGMVHNPIRPYREPTEAEQAIARLRAEVYRLSQELDEARTLPAKIAEKIRAELVCCYIYERIQAGEQVSRGGHHLCYWGEASARIAEDMAATDLPRPPRDEEAPTCAPSA